MVFTLKDVYITEKKNLEGSVSIPHREDAAKINFVAEEIWKIQ